jgi:peptidoglycan/LPS O-acetylase OafA/YrhL
MLTIQSDWSLVQALPLAVVLLLLAQGLAILLHEKVEKPAQRFLRKNRQALAI